MTTYKTMINVTCIDHSKHASSSLAGGQCVEYRWQEMCYPLIRQKLTCCIWIRVHVYLLHKTLV